MSDALRQRFPRSARLRSRLDFQAVYAGRMSVAAGPLVLYGLPRSGATAQPRLGLSVSRRVGNAVVRNRWKRRLRDVFRRLRSRLPAGIDFVVVVRAAGPPQPGLAGVNKIERLLVDLTGRLVKKFNRHAETSRPAGAERPPGDARSSPHGPERRT